MKAGNIGGSILILGDLFFDEKGTLPCDLTAIVERNNISMVVVGNVYSAVKWDNYEQILAML